MFALALAVYYRHVTAAYKFVHRLNICLTFNDYLIMFIVNLKVGEF